jgi:hypothetical protein
MQSTVMFNKSQTLRQVSSNSGGSSYSSGDSSGGLLWLAGIAFVLYLLVTYWYIAIPVGIVILILIGMGMSED